MYCAHRSRGCSVAAVFWGQESVLHFVVSTNFLLLTNHFLKSNSQTLLNINSLLGFSSQSTEMSVHFHSKNRVTAAQALETAIRKHFDHFSSIRLISSSVLCVQIPTHTHTSKCPQHRVGAPISWTYHKLTASLTVLISCCSPVIETEWQQAFTYQRLRSQRASQELGQVSLLVICMRKEYYIR